MTEPGTSSVPLKLLHSPSDAEKDASLLAGFVRFVDEQADEAICGGRNTPDGYNDLHAWSVDQPDAFWNAVWDFCGLVGDKGETVIENRDNMMKTRFFPDSKISFAENMLARQKTNIDEAALITRIQGGEDRVTSWQELYDQVSIFEQALRHAGIGEGDRVSAYMPNIPETIFMMLAASNLGAIFAPAGSELKPDAVIDRIGQVGPKILIAADGNLKGAKSEDRLAAIAHMQDSISSIEKVIIVPFINEAPDISGLKNAVLLSDFLDTYTPQAIEFVRRDFNHPQYILFSSGSTGAPKCFLHSAGGTLLKHATEHQLHSDIRPGDRLFYHASPSWMMWNWNVGALASGATVLLYVGNPFYPDAYAQLDFTAQNKCTHHGTSAPLIMAWKDAGLDLNGRHDLSLLRMVLSTGEILPPEGFEYVTKNISNVPIKSVSGGSDIDGCFVIGNAFMDTYSGLINAPALGMDVRLVDAKGQPVENGEMGEMLVFNACPTTLGFWKDDDAKKYYASYFEEYDGVFDQHVWCHGDQMIRADNGQLLHCGRSDTMLNQNSLKHNPSQIYKQIADIKEIEKMMTINYMRPDDKQSITVLVVKLSDGSVGALPDDVKGQIVQQIKTRSDGAYIPKEMHAVRDIVETPNGKRAEKVAKKILAEGRAPDNADLYSADAIEDMLALHEVLKRVYSAPSEAASG